MDQNKFDEVGFCRYEIHTPFYGIIERFLRKLLMFLLFFVLLGCLHKPVKSSLPKWTQHISGIENFDDKEAIYAVGEHQIKSSLSIARRSACNRARVNLLSYLKTEVDAKINSSSTVTSEEEKENLTMKTESNIKGVGTNSGCLKAHLDESNNVLYVLARLDKKIYDDVLNIKRVIAITSKDTLGQPQPTTRSFSVAQDQPILSYNQSQALVIGINDYTHLPDLSGAVNDAQKIAEVLEAQDFKVHLLLDSDATGEKIKRLLYKEIPQGLQENSRFVIYFAGHGTPQSVGTQKNMGYLMPVEAKEDYEGIEMSSIQKELRSRYPSKHILYLADACYSGLALSSRSIPLRKDIPGYLQEISSKKVQLQFTAGASGETAKEYTSQDGTHGLFTYFLLKGLKGEADIDNNKIITTAELWPYIQSNVLRVAQEQHYQQTPQYGRDGEGEMLFFVPSESKSDVSPNNDF